MGNILIDTHFPLYKIYGGLGKGSWEDLQHTGEINFFFLYVLMDLKPYVTFIT